MGDWHIFTMVEVLVAVEVAVAVPVAAGVGKATMTPASGIGCGGLTPITEAWATHFHTEGQSESDMHVVTLAWQLPGKLVVVVHTGALVTPASIATGRGAGVPEAPPVPEDVPPPALVPAPELPEPALALPAEPVAAVPVPVDTEHTPITEGWQTNPSPQSESALHGNCQR